MYFKNRNFWTDVLKAWSALTFDGPTSPEQVKKQILWLNSNIQVGGVPVCWSHWIKKGIVTIGDCLDRQNNFLSLDKLRQKYDAKIPFVEYLRIKKAIPFLWMEWVKAETDQEYKNWYKLYSGMASVVKIAYKDLNPRNDLLYPIIKKWVKDSPDALQLDQETLEKAIRNIYKLTNYIKLRSFQYCLLCKAIVTNV